MKAIVFATKMGGGHMSAANAVANALIQRGCASEVCDFLTLIGKRTSDIVGGAYISLVRRSPNAFGKLYRAGQFVSTPRLKSIVYFANTLYAAPRYKYIEHEQPDILLTSHIFAAQALTHLKHQHSDLPPTIGIMTDYTCAPFWEETELDAYITPHPLLDGEFTKKLMPAEKLHALGIPVAPACTPCGDSAPAKLAQGLDTGRAHLLVIGGSMGAGNLPEVVLSLQGVDALISVVCGNNKALFNQLSQQYAGDENVRILGYVSPMFPLMDSADIILSKSGGLTSTEIMTKRKPFIVINPIEGVETRNAEFFEQLGAAMYARTDADIRADVQRLLKDDALRADMRAAQERNIDSNASGRIAEFALAMANKE